MLSAELNQACVDACLRCLRDCERFLQNYLLAANPASYNEQTIRACRDCLEICNLCVSLLLRRDSLSAQIGQLCAELCQRGYEVCRAHKGDVLAQKCAHSCRDCAKICRQLALQAESG